MGVYSCLAISGHCLEFTGTTYAPGARREIERRGCTSNGGTFQEAPCTASGRLGRCVREQGAAGERTTHYYTGDASAHERLCTNEGHVWAPR
jgi:hypothetical protein